jgi:hypothetical protein
MARSRLGTSQFRTFGEWARGWVPALLAAILVATTIIATSVLAQDLPDTTPPVVKVTPSGVVGGMSGDLDSVINSTPSPRTFVLAAGTYPINSTIILNAGDNLRGPQVETATRGPAIYPVNPTADIVNGASLTRLIHMQGGNSEISWIEASGAIATDSNGLAATGGTPNTGTGHAINGTNGDTRDEIHHVYLHDNGSNGVGSPRGRIYYSRFERNTLNPDFLGHAGAAVKSVYEFEAAYNFIEHEQGNGLWADHGLRNQVLQPHGFWAHDNVIVNNDRFGIRYEYSPFLAEGIHVTVPDLTVGSDTLPTALVEDNYLAANARGGGAQEAAQNGLWRENTFGGFTLAGVTYAHNGAETGLADGLPRAAQAYNSVKTTDLWNAQFRNNFLNGEAIAGCSQPDEIVLCEGNKAKAAANVSTTQELFPQDTATLSANAGGTPTGTVDFALYGPNDANCSGTPAYSEENVDLTSGVANTNNTSFSVDQADSGNYKWIVHYDGDATHVEATSPCGKEAFTATIDDTSN